MKKREKIIVSLTVIVVLYGVYTYVLQKPGKTAKPQAVTASAIVERLSGFVQNATGVLKESTEGSAATAYMIARAENEWASDPFYTKKKEIEKATEIVKSASKVVVPEKSPILDFRYTGYLEVGKKRMAIINGNDYEVGGKLEPGGFVIRAIYPARIIIADSRGQRITIPFTEE